MLPASKASFAAAALLNKGWEESLKRVIKSSSSLIPQKDLQVNGKKHNDFG
jgi:hypothetical protein